MNKLTHILVKFKKNNIFFLVVLLSFLSMQWTSAHVHLAEQHDHAGIHEHASKVHTHEQTFTFDDAHSAHDTKKLVEIDHDCNRFVTNDDNTLIVLSLSVTPNSLHDPSYFLNLSLSNKSKRRYIDYSTISLRAPPRYS